jgi:hypothetical protein
MSQSTTTILSPYSGRVIRSITFLGDHAARGVSLMEVAARGRTA